MLKTGVICEYNPFHLGHLHQLRQARRAAGEECALVCVMGGNFVQRGEPAVFNMHARAEMALRCGADLVVELPLPWAVSSAEGFAQGGVALLEALGADAVSFGCECPEVERLENLARALLSGEAQELLRRHLSAGVSYAAARERAAGELCGEDAALLRGPNNILAVEYLKAMALRGSKMRPIAVPRFGPEHDGEERDGLASASGIRKLLMEGGDVSPLVPEAAFAVIKREIAQGRGPVSAQGMEGAMMYRLRTMTEGEFEALPDAGEGLWRRFMRCARTEPTLAEVLMAAKTKRYALSRLRRMALWAYLGLTAADREGDPPYIRVLALGERGREVLREAKAASPLPIVTKPASARDLTGRAGELFEKNARAGDLYALLYPGEEQRRGGAEWMASPVVL